MKPLRRNFFGTEKRFLGLSVHEKPWARERSAGPSFRRKGRIAKRETLVQKRGDPPFPQGGKCGRWDESLLAKRL